jgi:hypothetical protein
MIHFINYVWETTKPYTLLSADRVINNIHSINEVIHKNIPGDIVEIGVWKGGSVMSMLMALNNNGERRHVHLYDTFEGMTPPTEYDILTNHNVHYDVVIETEPRHKCKVELESVKQNVSSVRYPPYYIHYHVGDIMKTTEYPLAIALLRLDTDFYDSTKFELEHFYPLVSSGGIIIIDDYGFWKGSRKATDEFLIDKPNIVLNKIDNTGVWFYKP